MGTVQCDSDTVVPVEPDLLGFGVEIFHATLAGHFPCNYEWTKGESAVHVGINAVIAEINGHGLEPEEELSLVYRILAFGGLVEKMAQDPRTQEHVAESSDGYQVSQALVRLAASASLVATEEGALEYDQESLVRKLIN